MMRAWWLCAFFATSACSEPLEPPVVDAVSTTSSAAPQSGATSAKITASFQPRLAAKHEARIDSVVESAIADDACPGAVVIVVRHGVVVFRRAYGEASVQPEMKTLTADALFDLASLTKPMVTATAIVQLAERGKLRLGGRVAEVLPDFARNGKSKTTIAQLLKHEGGLAAANHLKHYNKGKEHALQAIYDLEPRHPVGERKYSDLGYIVLGALVEKVSGMSLDTYASKHIFAPLAMTQTSFNPRGGNIVPTTKVGEVHDPRASGLAGVAGHAGLFSSADDVARFARMLIAGGVLDGKRVLSRQSVASLSRLGFHRSGNGIGHTGFTGTSMWIDPKTRAALIILSSRLHPDGKGDVKPLRRELRSVVMTALKDQPLKGEPKVKTGIDVLRANGFAKLDGAKVGLITNHSGRANDGVRTLDLLHDAAGVNVLAVFSPEHGFGGSEAAAVKDSRDARTNLRIYSLYGESKRPSKEQLTGIDTLVFDIQDAGARFYTYATTLGYALETAASNGLRVVVLDRPNPIDGQHVEGPLLDAGRRSFIGYHTIPVRHGMTLGELSMMFNVERKIGAKLEVVAMLGWQRTMRFEDTGLRWVAPSPNLRSPHAVLLYPGLALLEASNVSVGRGTDAPFELIGAPWLDGKALAAALASALGSEVGVAVRPTRFTPTTSKHAGKECSGVAFRVTDPERFDSVRLGIAIAFQLRSQSKTFNAQRVLTNLGNGKAHAALMRGASVDEIVATWTDELRAFQQRRAPHLMY